MKYCRSCILPDTRPNIRLDSEGICNACNSHSRRGHVDWADRERSFQVLADRARERASGYDCVIPVSGGKDSTWQVVKCLEYGLRPLTVTWRAPARTPLGTRNLENLMRLGVDHIDYQISREVERRFAYRTLVELGSTAVPMHMAIFAIPLRIAVSFKIPLVVWGENTAIEYGEVEEDDCRPNLDADWVSKYGVVHGTTARDWVSDELTEKDLAPYFGPSEEELSAADVQAVFLGYFLPWDPNQTYEIAAAHGFEGSTAGPRTGYYDYADVDDDFISIHHYLKWHKFGFTRSYDNLSLEIRNGRLTRDQAIEILRQTGDETPHDDIAKFCEFSGITVEHFFEVIETFRNHDVWVQRDGKWMIDGFLIEDWEW